MSELLSASVVASAGRSISKSARKLPGTGNLTSQAMPRNSSSYRRGEIDRLEYRGGRCCLRMRRKHEEYIPDSQSDLLSLEEIQLRKIASSGSYVLIHTASVIDAPPPTSLVR